jgi:hypothetical protein
VRLILSLPISYTDRDDAQIWRASKNGDFIVRSAYYMQKELEKRGMAESSVTPTHSKVWSKI